MEQTALSAREPDPSRELELFPDLLLTEEDPPPLLEHRGPGSFARIAGDWIVCRDRRGTEDGPPGPNFRMEWEGRTYDSIGLFNNDAVNLALRSTTEPAALGRAESMFRAGYANDPHFFAFNYNLARLLRIRRSFDEALSFSIRSETMIPRDYRLQIILGFLYERKREDVAAQIHYRQAVRANPFSAEALIELAGFYRRTDRESLAEDLLRRGMNRFETDPTLRLGLGELRMRQGRYNDARVLFESIDRPEKERSMFNLRLQHRMAQLYDRMGDYRRSKDAYARLLADTSHPYFLDQDIAGLRREKERVERLARYE